MKKKLLQYGITTLIGGLIAYWVMDTEGIFLIPGETAEMLSILCDAFFVPGILLLMVGAMAWISTTGLFDSLGYAFSVVVHAFLPGGRTQTKSFYDYKLDKAEKRGKVPYFLLIVGAGFALVSMVFLVIWTMI